MKIGVMNSSNTKLRGGPKVFMDRITEELKKQGLYSDDKFDAWLNLSFREIPKFVIDNKIPVTLRFDGIWKIKVIPDRFKFISKFLRKKLNEYAFQKFNKLILHNYYIADNIIFQSQFSKKSFETTLLRKPIDKKHTIIYNGVDLERFKPSSQKINSNLQILVSHKMHPVKRFDQIPKIIKELVKKYPNLMVNVLGDGIKNPYRLNENTLDYFKKQVSLHGLDNNFNFIGHIEPNLLADFYVQNDFMLNLSYSDPCPNVVIEAMACGLPVIAPIHGGIAELVSDERLLVKENLNEYDFDTMGDYKSLPQIPVEKYLEKIYYLLENLEFHQKNMRKRAEQYFDIKNVTKQYINFMKENMKK